MKTRQDYLFKNSCRFTMRQGIVTFLLLFSFCTFAQTTGKLHTSGKKLIDKNGNELRLIGVARPGFQSWPRQRKIIEEDFMKMKEKCANVVRIAIDEKFYMTDQLGNKNAIENSVNWAIKHGLYVILDLHHSRGGVASNKGDIHPMADEWSIEFWREVASKYKNRDSVIFELYNEPNRITAQEVRNGGMHPDGWRMVGFQELYDTVRAQGADNVVIVGCRHWSYDLRYYETNPINGYNIMYSTHVYPYADKMQDNWFQWTGLAKTHPVIMTEFGPETDGCPNDPSFVDALVDTMDTYGVHSTAWAWFDNYPCRGMFSTLDPENNNYVTRWWGDWVFNFLNEKNCGPNVNTQEIKKESIKIFPNPVESILMIENNGFLWDIMDINGRKVLTGSTKNIDVVGLSPGVYIIQLQGTNQFQRFVKK